MPQGRGAEGLPGGQGPEDQACGGGAGRDTGAQAHGALQRRAPRPRDPRREASRHRRARPLRRAQRKADVSPAHRREGPEPQGRRPGQAAADAGVDCQVEQAVRPDPRHPCGLKRRLRRCATGGPRGAAGLECPAPRPGGLRGRPHRRCKWQEGQGRRPPEEDEGRQVPHDRGAACAAGARDRQRQGRRGRRGRRGAAGGGPRGHEDRWERGGVRGLPKQAAMGVGHCGALIPQPLPLPRGRQQPRLQWELLDSAATPGPLRRCCVL
mmetsp:Transcript_25165/g.69156  ORF Transcript_25165/g.69156 Transcript_25165/m.69156 type:complete len:267 (-) Transcript_25165:420-1220(-)